MSLELIVSKRAGPECHLMGGEAAGGGGERAM